MDADQWPTLRSWSDGLPEEQVVVRHLALGDLYAAFLGDLDRLLATLENAHPERLAGKRREFRAASDLRAFYDLMSELVVAGWLARHRVQFAFGKPGQPMPDLLLYEGDIAIEVTRREARAEERFGFALQSAVRAAGFKGLKMVTTFSLRPLRIRASRQEQIIEEALHALARGDKWMQAVVRPATPQQPAITVRIDFSGGLTSALPSVRHIDDALLSPKLADLEALIKEALEDQRKAAQSQVCPTLLLVDISDVTDSWLRPPAAWGANLTRLLADHDRFVGVGVFHREGFSGDPRVGISANLAADPQVAEVLRRLAGDLGMRHDESHLQTLAV